MNREEAIAINFSGGRSSAYMLVLLQRMAQQDGGWPANWVVVFCNTGKEVGNTLAFVKAAEQWFTAAPILWLERGEGGVVNVVDDLTASHDGEPFSQLITEKNYLPHPRARFCTEELKVKPVIEFMGALGYDDFSHALGIRSDEPRRIARMRQRDDVVLPLVDARVTQADVERYWFESRMIPSHEPLSNCDLCFMKGTAERMGRIQSEPSMADWWAAQEEKTGARFTMRGLSYHDMQVIATDQADLFDDYPDDSVGDCWCSD